MISDGVLFNFGDSVRRYLDYLDLGHLWKSGPTERPYWDFYKDWDWTSEMFVDFCNQGADDGFIFCGPTRPDAVTSVNRVKNMGHHVVIITDRQFGSKPEVSHDHTRRWLAEHGFQYDELHFSADKTCVPTDMFVEDKLDNYDALHEVGTDVYLVNRAWNQVRDTRARVHDAMEYADMVEARTNGLIVV